MARLSPGAALSFHTEIKVHDLEQHKVKRIKNTQDGFSLVEVALALGVSGLLLYGLASITQNTNTAQNSVNVTADIDNFINLVTLKISNQGTCFTLIGQNTLSSTQQASSAATLNSSLLPPLPSGVSQTGILIQNMLSAAAPSGTISWPAQLVFNFQKNSPGNGTPTTITRTVPFLASSAPVTPNPTSIAITGCGPPSLSANLQQACQSLGWTWNPTSQPACQPSALSSCTALGGTLDNSTNPPQCKTGTAPVQQTRVTVTDVTCNYTDNVYSIAPAYMPAYLCVCQVTGGNTNNTYAGTNVYKAVNFGGDSQSHIMPIDTCPGTYAWGNLAFCNIDLSSTQCGMDSSSNWSCVKYTTTVPPASSAGAVTPTTTHTQCHCTRQIGPGPYTGDPWCVTVSGSGTCDTGCFTGGGGAGAGALQN